jgi:NTP pyrophosphatase (non-canonical NTP hydrolase)
MENENSQSRDLQIIADDLKEWSDKTFGERMSSISMAFHLQQETEELVNSLRDYYYSPNPNEKLKEDVYFEFADCFMLLIDAASHFPMDMNTLIEYTKRKLEINKRRKWGEPDENGVVNHLPDEHNG